MDKPILFLDVDGVLNVLALFFKDDPPPFEGVDWGHGAVAAIPEGVKERVERLTEVFEPQWATAWWDRANLFNKHWGWEPWPVLRWGMMKLPHIVTTAGERRWAFVDDDAYWEAEEFVHQFGPVPDHGLVVPVAPHIGLTDSQVDHLIEWAKRPRTESQSHPETQRRSKVRVRS
jgi:hypothetical protein